MEVRMWDGNRGVYWATGLLRGLTMGQTKTPGQTVHNRIGLI